MKSQVLWMHAEFWPCAPGNTCIELARGGRGPKGCHVAAQSRRRGADEALEFPREVGMIGESRLHRYARDGPFRMRVHVSQRAFEAGPARVRPEGAPHPAPEDAG